jgi:hypothetical protein
MKRGCGLPEIAALKTHWCRWVKIVELFARRRANRGRVDPQEYVRLHKELIANCRALAESAKANEVKAAVFRHVEELVEPWLTPSVLERADREILIHLLVRCRQVERQLGLGSRARMVLGWATQALVASLCVAVGFLLVGASNAGWHSGLDRLRGWSDGLWFVVTRSSDLERLVFIGIALLIVSIVTVQRAARS